MGGSGFNALLGQAGTGWQSGQQAAEAQANAAWQQHQQTAYQQGAQMAGAMPHPFVSETLLEHLTPAMRRAIDPAGYMIPPHREPVAAPVEPGLPIKEAAVPKSRKIRIVEE